MPRRQSSSTTINDIEATVMVVISGMGEAYGYDLINLIDKETGGHISLSVGRLYPLLHRLVKAGYLSTRWGSESETKGTGGARRKYYKLTKKGNNILNEFLATYRQRQFILLEATSTI